MEKIRKLNKKNKELSFLLLNIILGFIFLLILHFLNIFDINLILRFRYVVVIILLLFSSVVLLFFEEDKKSKKIIYEPYLKKFFLFGLVLIFITTLNYEYITNFEFFDIQIKALQIIKNYILAFTIISGFFTFYFNSERIEKEIKKEKSYEKKKEKERTKEFEKKFEKINKIPILRNIIKWMYKEGWWYSLGLVLIILISISLYFYGLGNYGFQMDEFYHAGVVKTYTEEGKLFYINEGTYTRSRITSLIGILAFEVFSKFPHQLTEEFVMRSPIAFLGIANIVLIYIITRNFLNRNLALLSTAFFAFETYIMYFATYFRFYTISIFLILLFLQLSIKYYKNNFISIILAAISFLLYRYLSEYFLFMTIFFLMIFTFNLLTNFEEIKSRLFQKTHLLLGTIILLGIIIFNITTAMLNRLSSDSTYNLVSWSLNTNNMRNMSDWLILNYYILFIPLIAAIPLFLLKANIIQDKFKIIWLFVLTNLIFLFVYVVNVPFNFTFRVTLFFLPIIFVLGFQSFYHFFSKKTIPIFILTIFILINLYTSVKYHINDEGDLYHPTKLPYEKIEIVTDNKGMGEFLNEYIEKHEFANDDLSIGYIGIGLAHVEYYYDRNLEIPSGTSFRNRAIYNSTLQDLLMFISKNQNKNLIIIINANAIPRTENQLFKNASEANPSLREYIINNEKFHLIYVANDKESEIYIYKK